MEKSKKIIVIVGPTAVGKTNLSIQLAKDLNCEIISADSRQFYREMNIGTAKPIKAEMQEVPHHFINNLSIQDTYTAGMFEKQAIQKIADLHTNNDHVIVVGGSGLFINALCFGLDEIPGDKSIRDELINELKTNGIEKLQNELKAKDEQYFNEVDIHNPQRIIRALETIRLTGKPYSSFRTNTNKPRPFEIIWIGLNDERAVLYERINNRVDQMISNGLLEEVNSLRSFKDNAPLQTVGYQEFYQNTDTEKAIELVKRNSRRYAKRQITFFKRIDQIKWFKPNNYELIKKEFNF